MKKINEVKKLISSIIEDVCDILQIENINFELIDIVNQNKGAGIAVYLTEDDALKIGFKNELIFIDINYAFNSRELDLVSTIAHEVRHAYQKRNPEIYEKSFENYKRINKDGLIEYATQFVEVDAVAFSEIYLFLYSGKNLSLGLPPEVRKLVDSRKQYILKSLQI